MVVVLLLLVVVVVLLLLELLLLLLLMLPLLLLLLLLIRELELVLVMLLLATHEARPFLSPSLLIALCGAACAPQAFYKAAKKKFDDDPAFKETAQKAVVKLQVGGRRWKGGIIHRDE